MQGLRALAQEQNGSHLFSQDLPNAVPAEVRMVKGAISVPQMGLVLPLD